MYIMIAEAISTLAVFTSVGAIIGRVTEISGELRVLANGEALGTHPRGWRWGGLVYYAPEDRALLVPKRSGLGQTFNWTRPSAWILLVVTLAVPAAIAIISHR